MDQKRLSRVSRMAFYTSSDPLGEPPRKTHLTYIIHEQKFGRPVLWAPLDRGELQWVEDKVSLWTFWRLALW